MADGRMKLRSDICSNAGCSFGSGGQEVGQKLGAEEWKDI